LPRRAVRGARGKAAVGGSNLYIIPMELDLPFYAVQRLANGRWLIRTQLGDPLLPPVNVVAVVGEQTGSSALPQPAKLDSRVDTGGRAPC